MQHTQNHAFLAVYGYDRACTLQEHLSVLKSRLLHARFPHEIGVFLGYPLRDIYCFIHHPQQGCLAVGEWKVYHNADQALRMFSRFRACRKALVRKIANGRTLAQIFRAS